MDPKAPFAQCSDCPLKNHTFVPPSTHAGPIAIVGESPGRTEAVKGAPFVGPSGELLWNSLRLIDVARTDAHVTNAVLCFPGEEVPPEALMCCRERLVNELRTSGATHILSLGKEARTSLTNDDDAISTVRGRWVLSEAVGAWVLPTYHPAYLLRSPDGGVEYLRDIAKFAQRSPRPYVSTNVQFWHYPDSKMRKWIEPDLRLNHDTDEAVWLKDYCVAHDITWTSVTEGLELLANKESLRAAAQQMIAEIEGLLAAIPEQCDGYVAIDLETTGYSPQLDRILNLSLAWREGTAAVVSGGLLWHPRIVEALRRLFTDPTISWIGHNGKFDMKFLVHQLKVAPTLHHDTFVMHGALDERSQLSLHALKPLVSTYFDVPDYEKETITRYLPSRKTSFANVPPSLLGRYAGMDTDYTRRLFLELQRELEDQSGVLRLYNDLLMPAVRAFIPIELHGVYIDWERLTDVLRYLEKQERRVLKRLCELTGDITFNPNSPKKVQHILWQVKGYRRPSMRGKESDSSRKEVVKILADQHPEDEFLALLLDIRRYRKLMSSYVKNLHHYSDGLSRVHPSFNVCGTEVGRLSASEPAIQTIPRAYEATGKLIRDFYAAPPGYVLMQGDYSQAELRAAAVQSQDPFLLQVYQDGRDLHTEVALSMYGPKYTKEQRNICKMFNFAYLYGGTEHSFAFDAGMDISTATEWVRRYNSLMSGLSQWRVSQYRALQRQGYVESPTGRRRRFPFLVEANVADAKKSVVHAPCAGTASDLTLNALVEMQRTAPNGVHVIITVHDSNIIEVPDNDESIAAASEMLRTVMTGSARALLGDQIPFDVDVEIGFRWGSLREYDGTPLWREKVDHRLLFDQTEFLARMEHVVCAHCGRWNPPTESRRGDATKCMTCGGDLQ